ncbi:MAG: hypothetical protein NVS3B18_02720 [Candidatus Dormibacteria bacterium]
MSRVRLAAIAAALACAGCATSSSTPSVPGANLQVSNPGRPGTYVAVGASETVGAGADIDRLRDAWPAAFYARSLPRATVYYNLGIGGETTAGALTAELPGAQALGPDLVSVWLNVDDLGAGVSPADYEAHLSSLVHALRQGGRARVLVANTPVLDGLPLVRFCLGEGPPPANQKGGCPLTLPGGLHLTRPLLDGAVAAYNQAIARVVSAQGAILVDLHAQGDVGLLHPDYVDREDGFHPSDRGHAAIAAVFGAALRAAGGP